MNLQEPFHSIDADDGSIFETEFFPTSKGGDNNTDLSLFSTPVSIHLLEKKNNNFNNSGSLFLNYTRLTLPTLIFRCLVDSDVDLQRASILKSHPSPAQRAHPETASTPATRQMQKTLLTW